jgi:AcrR family transcriptional regulator
MQNRPRLSREKIVQAAASIIEAEGETGFSMRRLATALDVDPMAIYHHVANKSALLHAVIGNMLADFTPPPPTGEWRADIWGVCEAIRTMARKHPEVFMIYETYEEWVPEEHAVQEAFLRTLRKAGFSPHGAVQGMRVLLTYAEAFAYDEVDGWLGIGDREDLLKSLKKGDFPVMETLVGELEDADADRHFTFGLTVLLDGLEAALARG